MWWWPGVGLELVTTSVQRETQDVFTELGGSLCLWTDRLYQRLCDAQVEQVFFLSREGQPLQRMFDAYVERVGGSVQSRYLEVSRRATLLPSLGPLEAEQFDTLFRQYRAISLKEFLSSLGLEDGLESLSQALKLNPGEVSQRQEDFPSSPLFAKLRANAEFCSLYETQRGSQREAFIDYLRELAGGQLPKSLAVVDVGWKGTIQDNLHALLCEGDAPLVEAVRGYYVGLISPGSAGPTNTKEGLLFSGIGTRSFGFQVFNENKSLFEVVLAADHGSVIGYTRDAEGRGRPVRGSFDEDDMLKRSVFPVLRNVEHRFRCVLATWPTKVTPQRVAEITGAHAQMVFRPSPAERAWFDSVFHVENFGLFERSFFSDASVPPPLRARVQFLIRLLRQRNVGELGFWPWATLRHRAGRLPASAYAAIRQWQAGRGAHG